MAVMDLADFKEWAEEQFATPADVPELNSRLHVTFDESLAGESYIATDGVNTYTGTVPAECEVDIDVAGLNTTYTLTCSEYSVTAAIGNYYLYIPLEVEVPDAES